MRHGIPEGTFNSLVGLGVNERWLSQKEGNWELFDSEQDPDGVFIKALKSMGYDGAILLDTDGVLGFDTYAVFNSFSIKSSASITYDDNGSVIPLSERFDSSRDDVRY